MRFAVGFGLLFALACGDGAVDPGSGGDAGSSGTDADAAGGSDASPDLGAVDADPVDAGTEDVGPGRVPQPFPPLEPVVIEDWRIAFVAAGAPDPLSLPFIRGEVPFPEELGRDELGLRWLLRDLDEQGQPPPDGVGTYYLAARVEVEETTRWVAQLDSVTLSVDGLRVPGDPYRSGRHRVPVVLTPGRHELVARGTSFRGLPRIRFFRSEAPIAPNLDDVTFPDLLPRSGLSSPLGVQVLNLTAEPLDLEARVEGDETFARTAVANDDLPPEAVTQVSFQLETVAALNPDTTGTATATLVFDHPDWPSPYAVEYPLSVVDGTRPYRHTRRSAVDRSTQYHAVHPPSDFDPGRDYALALSLHGASVEAIGQARAYGQKDWLFLVAPTNRRPFGFDWQDWGRLDALEALDWALDALPIDPTQVHLTGHSMGGHGSWHLGVLHSDRFATVGPSAGWVSFFTLGTTPTSIEGLERARAHSYTRDYYENLSDEAVYIIHGSADDNIPVGQSRDAFSDLQGVPVELTYHEQPGAGHWWDDDPETPGAACVDWPPLFETMQRRRLEVSPLELAFRSPNPGVRSRFGFVEVQAAEDPYADFTVRSQLVEGALRVETTNVRSLILDGDRLGEAGLDAVSVDGAEVEVVPGPIRVGESAKRPGQYGPFKEVMFRPFCFVYADGDPEARNLAAYFTSTFSILGNGRACAVPFSERDRLEPMNRIYIGVSSADLELPAGYPFSWSPEQIDLGAGARPEAGGVALFPEGEHLSAAIFATEGEEGLYRLLFEVQPPFSSRSGLPDYASLVLVDGEIFYGELGFFDADWNPLPPR